MRNTGSGFLGFVKGWYLLMGVDAVNNLPWYTPAGAFKYQGYLPHTSSDPLFLAALGRATFPPGEGIF